MTLLSRAEALGEFILDTDASKRDIYRPALVMSPASVTAFGGSMVDGVSLTIAALASAIAVGQDVLIWNGTNGGAPNGSYTHTGSGSFAFSARQYLNATSFGDGCVKVVGNDYATSGAAGQLSEWDISTINGTDWGLYASGGHAYTVGLNLSQYALASDLTTLESADTAEAFARALGDRDLGNGIRYSDGVAAELQPKALTTVEAGAWATDNLGPISTGLDVEFLIRPGAGVAGGYAEILTQQHSANGAGEDNFELAVWESDGAGGTTAGKLYLYCEITNTGDSAESASAAFDIGLREGVPVRGLLRINFGAGTCKAYTVSDATVYDLTLNGRYWLEHVAVTDSGTWTSIDDITDDWYIGLNYTSGGIREVKAWHDTGLATVLLDVNAEQVAVGSVNFTDDNAVAWATTNGVVRHSLSDRVDAAGGTVDVVSNVATNTILGRLTAGSGDSEELTLAQVRAALGGWQVLHDVTLGSDAGDSTTPLSYDVTGYSRFRVMFIGNGTRNATGTTLRMRLNNDSSSVYGTDAAALTDSWSLGTIPGISTNTDRVGMVDVRFGGASGYLKVGISDSTNVLSTATVGAADVDVGLFSTLTAAVTSIQLFTALNQVRAGSRIVIEGLA